MPLYLEVPYKEKELAKRLGAKWDPGRKQWYAPDKKDYRKLIRWYPYLHGHDELLCDWIYIVESVYKCTNCNKNTNVIAFAAENYFVIETRKGGKYRTWKYHDEYIRLMTREDKVQFFSEEEDIKHEPFEKYLKERFGFYYYDSSNGRDCYANHCWECGAVLDIELLHERKGGPFYLDTSFGCGRPQPSDYKLYKILLSEDGLMTQYFTGNWDYTCDQFILDKDKKIELIDFQISIYDL